MSGYSAKAGDDNLIHNVDAGSDALIDPSPYRTRCGRRVFEVYNTPVPITCPKCTDQRNDESPSG